MSELPHDESFNCGRPSRSRQTQGRSSRWEMMTMAKPKTELGQRCPAPAYMEWLPFVRPILSANVQRGLSTGKRLRVSLSTDDPEVAKRVMGVLVPQLVIDGRLAPESEPARVYGRGSATAAARAKKVVRLKMLSQSEYDAQVPLTAQHWGVPKQIIHVMVQRKPTLTASAFSTRRMRRRKRGEQILKATSWHYWPPRGKHFYLHRKRISARLRLGNTHHSWPLPTRDLTAAAEIMEPVGMAWERVHQAAVRTLDYEVGSVEHAYAVRNREKACVALAAAIIETGGPMELVKFVQVPPPGESGTALPKAVKAKAARSALLEKCVQRYIEHIKANPEGPPKPREEFAAEMMQMFHVTWHEARLCRQKAIKRTSNANWAKPGRRAR
jgi:hypothetical protein